MALLDHLGEYADRLDKKSVVDKIWPNLVCIILDIDQTNVNAGLLYSKQGFRIRLP